LISTTSRRKLSKSFILLKGEALKEIHTILIETLREYAPSYAAVKNWATQIKRGDFSRVSPRLGRHKTVTTPVIIEQIQELILEDRRISAKSIVE